MAITAPPAARTVTLSIDGQELSVPEGTTIYDAAKQVGVEIPVLCHDHYDSNASKTSLPNPPTL